MKTCDFCGEKAEYKVTTSLNPKAVSYSCKRCLANKKKELNDVFTSILKDTFPLVARLEGIDNFIDGAYKKTLFQVMKVKRIGK